MYGLIGFLMAMGSSESIQFSKCFGGWSLVASSYIPIAVLVFPSHFDILIDIMANTLCSVFGDGRDENVRRSK